jgi:hypothetical protein
MIGLAAEPVLRDLGMRGGAKLEHSVVAMRDRQIGWQSRSCGRVWRAGRTVTFNRETGASIMTPAQFDCGALSEF